MLFKDPSASGFSRAETAFREAFERLKIGKTNILPKGSRVTQNNVAREAGLDPSALKKARFPTLIEDIKSWILHHGSQQSRPPSKSIYTQRNHNRTLREQVESLKKQRDNALARLVDADSRILALTMENKRLQSSMPKSNILKL